MEEGEPPPYQTEDEGNMEEGYEYHEGEDYAEQPEEEYPALEWRDWGKGQTNSDQPLMISAGPNPGNHPVWMGTMTVYNDRIQQTNAQVEAQGNAIQDLTLSIETLENYHHYHDQRIQGQARELEEHRQETARAYQAYMTTVDQQRQRLEMGLIEMRTQGNSNATALVTVDPELQDTLGRQQAQITEMDGMVRQLWGMEQGRQATAAAGSGSTREVEELHQRHEELQDNVITLVGRIEEICGDINNRIDLREEEEEEKQESHLKKQGETEESLKHLWKEVNNLNGIVGQHASVIELIRKDQQREQREQSEMREHYHHLNRLVGAQQQQHQGDMERQQQAYQQGMHQLQDQMAQEIGKLRAEITQYARQSQHQSLQQLAIVETQQQHLKNEVQNLVRTRTPSPNSASLQQNHATAKRMIPPLRKPSPRRTRGYLAPPIVPTESIPAGFQVYVPPNTTSCLPSPTGTRTGSPKPGPSAFAAFAPPVGIAPAGPSSFTEPQGKPPHPGNPFGIMDRTTSRSSTPQAAELSSKITGLGKISSINAQGKRRIPPLGPPSPSSSSVPVRNPSPPTGQGYPGPTVAAVQPPQDRARQTAV